MGFTMARVHLGQPYGKNKLHQRCRLLKGPVLATYMPKSLSQKVINSWSITESQSYFQAPLWQGSLKIPLKELLPAEGASWHPATVPKERCPPSEGTARGQIRWLGKRSAGQLHLGFPPGKEGLLACPLSYVPTSGETSS